MDGGRYHVDSDGFLTCPHFSCDVRDFRLVADPSDYKLLDYGTFAFILLIITHQCSGPLKSTQMHFKTAPFGEGRKKL